VSIRVTTLGAVQVVRGDSVLAALPAQRLRCALLVYMAVARTAARDKLLALFWPERTEERARHALSQTIYELRRALGDDWIDIRGEQLVVASHISIDIAAFEESVERGDYANALGLYRGAFLDGFYVPAVPAFESWVDTVRQRAQRHQRRARREWIRHLMDQAKLKEALAAARDWTTIDPADDEAQHRLIELLAETGDRAGAIRQYELYEKMVAADDLEPLDETRELVARIRSGAVGALPAGSAITPAAATPPRTSSPPPAPATVTALPLVGPPPRRDRRFRIGLVVVAATAMVLFSGVLLRFTRGRELEPVAAATAHRIAVLYFDDRSPPPGAPHLAAGVSERLIEAFSGLGPQLIVQSKNAVARYRNVDVSWDTLARSLGVELFVTGTVVRDAGQVRVSVQLVDPEGSVLLNRRIQRADGLYLELLDEVADTVAVMLRRRMGARFDAQLRRNEAPSNEAWLALSLGTEANTAAARLSDESLDAAYAGFARADSLFERAEQFDRKWSEPTMQRARTAMNVALLDIASGHPDRGRVRLDTALAHLDRVLRHHPRSAAARELRGMVLYRAGATTAVDDQDFVTLLDRAEADLLAAVETDRTRAQPYAQLASLYWTRGRFAEANRAARQAQEMDAFLRHSLEHQYTIAMTEFERGNDAEATTACYDGLRRFHDQRFTYCVLTLMAWSEYEPPRPDSAWKLVDAVTPKTASALTQRGRPLLEMLVAATLVRAGQRDSARAVLDRAAQQPSSSAGTTWIEAAVRGRLGDTERATQLLVQYFSKNRGLTGPVARGRALRPLLDDPAIVRALPLRDR
jgi:DNA-binding SARP family transcriptional activator/TolB-like protein